MVNVGGQLGIESNKSGDYGSGTTGTGPIPPAEADHLPNLELNVELSNTAKL